jgi:deoxyinosine 3'endonuclease (endonuclease V)
MLRSRLVLQDDFEWSLPSTSSDSDKSDAASGELKYIGGVDISFLKEDPSTACASLVVLDVQTLEIVHEESDIVRMQVPYIPGFLAFREVLLLLHTISPLLLVICFEPRKLQTHAVYLGQTLCIYF